VEGKASSYSSVILKWTPSHEAVVTTSLQAAPVEITSLAGVAMTSSIPPMERLTSLPAGMDSIGFGLTSRSELRC